MQRAPPRDARPRQGRALTEILITGASRGLGRAFALALARPGARLWLAARDAHALAEVAARVVERGARAEIVALDVTDTDATVRAVRGADEASGGLDLILANAGAGAARAAPPYAWESMEAALRTSFLGAAATITAALPAMVARRRGHVVATGSLSSYGPLPGCAAYGPPKAGIDMLLETLRLDLLGTGVAVTNLRLGFVRTRMVEHSTHPMPQLLEPDEVAREVVCRLPERPREIVMPRALAAATRALAALPPPAREALWSAVRPRR